MAGRQHELSEVSGTAAGRVARRRCAATGLLLAIVLAVPVARGAPPSIRSAVTSSKVEALLHHRNRVYVGGGFARIGPNTGPAVSLDPGTGAVHPRWPRVVGAILASAPDGSGGFFLGGDFASVGGTAVRNLAHVRADGSLDTGFRPAPDAPVHALALGGDRLYAGGAFSVIGGRSRNRVAALDASTGSVDPGFDPDIGFEGASLAPSPVVPAIPQVGLPSRGSFEQRCESFRSFRQPQSGVLALAVLGNRVYVGGSFSSVSGFERRSLAALDAATGVVDPGFDPDSNSPGFNPNAKSRRVDVNGPVFALAVLGDRLYLGGRFSSVAGRSRAHLAAVNAVTGGVDASFDAAPNDEVHALVAAGERVYAGGEFSGIGGLARRGLASLDPVTGRAMVEFKADADADVNALALGGDLLYAGGQFSQLSGAERDHVGAVNAATGAVSAGFDPGADDTVATVSLGGGRLLAGGLFHSAGGARRGGLAAVDAATGTLDRSFAPGVRTGIRLIAARGDRIYVAGRIGEGKSARSSIVAVDAGTGRLDPRFKPSLRNAPTALAVSGDRLYVALGVARGARNAAVLALDPRTGARLSAFSGRAPGPVSALAASSTRVYAAGTFSRATGKPERRVPIAPIALRASDGSRDAAFRPRLAMPSRFATLHDIELAQGRLYLLGGFSRVDGLPRRGLAAVHPGSGALVRTFRPPVIGGGARLALAAGRLFVNASAARNDDVTALSARTGRRLAASDPRIGGRVCAVAATPSRLFVGGTFGRAGGAVQPNLALFRLPSG